MKKNEKNRSFRGVKWNFNKKTRNKIVEDNNVKGKINELKGLSDTKDTQAEQNNITIASAEAFANALSKDENKKEK